MTEGPTPTSPLAPPDVEGATASSAPVRRQKPWVPMPGGRPPALVATVAAVMAVVVVLAGFLAVFLPRLLAKAPHVGQANPTTAPTVAPIATLTPLPTPLPPTPLPPTPLPPTPDPTATPFQGAPFEPLGAPVLDNGVVYVTTQDGNLFALDATTGAMRWRYHAQPVGGGPPTVANGVVYLTASDVFNPNDPNSHFPPPTYLYALNASTGALIWRVPGLVNTGKLLVVNGVIYSGGHESGAFAYRASDGTVLWHTDLGSCDNLGLAYDSTYLYFNASNCLGLVSMRLSDGQGGWLSRGSGPGVPTVANGTIYLGNLAIRPSDGAIVKTFGVNGANSTDAYANGTLYIASDKSLVAFNASTGAKVWQDDNQSYSPWILGLANGVLYSGSDVRYDHNLYAYRVSDGAMLWKAAVDPEEPFDDRLSQGLGDTVYVGTVDGAVVALRTADGTVLWRTPLG